MHIPSHVAASFAEAARYFPTQIQQFQFFDKYSRYNPALGRRETWIETVDRAVAYLRTLSDNRLSDNVYGAIRANILGMAVMPSMRLLAMGGKAATRHNACIYNCSAMSVDSLDTFVEALILSMCGCGVGFSVESRFVRKFRPVTPVIPSKYLPVFVVPDSSEGWAAALSRGLEVWWRGADIRFDLSKIRPAGAVLVTKGGRASGPEPLRAMLAAVREVIRGRGGKRIRPIDAHDIMCLIGDCAVQGGVRRTAMLSLFDYDDAEMLAAKTGKFWETAPHRMNANNSAVWPDGELSYGEISDRFHEMHANGTGEPGVFRRANLRDRRPARRADCENFLTNPCGEIVLRANQLCNLSIVVNRAGDTLERLKQKIELATIIGTIQATADHFPGMRSTWKENAVEERLLGVDITGQMDSPLSADVLRALREHAVLVNAAYAKKLGIRQAAAVTCVKPGGNSSVLVDCSAGIGPRWSAYYLRNARVGAHSPVFKVLRDAGVEMKPEVGQDADTADRFVVGFPVKSPPGVVTRNDMSALDKCAVWRDNKVHFTEHNPSTTVTYREAEIPHVIDWIATNQNVVGGMAFLPGNDHIYDLAPYQEIEAAEYERRAAQFPTIDWSELYRHERTDQTTAAQEVACLSGACDVLL